jgi:coiled-coil domain-containing protein 130
MSSLAATQADGYYVPVDYFTSGEYKKKSLNQYQGSNGHSQYLQRGVVRFELPYDGFCLTCGTPVGRGTRFNARKVRAGAYISSPIYEFHMTCRICAVAEFVIRTNPKEQSFDYISGIHRRQDFSNTTAAAAATSVTSSFPTKLNGLSQLEASVNEKRKIETDRDALEALLRVNERTFGADFQNNSSIRSSFRIDRKKKKARLESATKLGWAKGMEVLLESDLEDIVKSKLVTFSNGRHVERQKLHHVQSSSMFPPKDESKRRPSSRRQKEDSNVRQRGDKPKIWSSSQTTTTARKVTTHLTDSFSPDTTLSQGNLVNDILSSNLQCTITTQVKTVKRLSLDSKTGKLSMMSNSLLSKSLPSSSSPSTKSSTAITSSPLDMLSLYHSDSE